MSTSETSTQPTRRVAIFVTFEVTTVGRMCPLDTTIRHRESDARRTSFVLKENVRADERNGQKKYPRRCKNGKSRNETYLRKLYETDQKIGHTKLGRTRSLLIFDPRRTNSGGTRTPMSSIRTTKKRKRFTRRSQLGTANRVDEQNSKFSRRN